MEKKILFEMFKMQKQLNDSTNGEGWVSGYTKDNQIINWKRCIYVECIELIESFSWKHWKDINKAPNWENIKIELVDIWHFIMSLAMEKGYYKRKSIEKIVENISDLANFCDFCKDAYLSEDTNTMYILNQVEYIVNKASGNDKDFLDDIIDEFFLISLNCGVNLEILYINYMGKNILNKFRQDNGYKDGSYVKIWNGKEDNIVLMEILKNQPLSSDEIYLQLEIIYNSIGKSS